MARRKARAQDRDGLYRRDDSPWWWGSYKDARGRRARRSTETADRAAARAVRARWVQESWAGRLLDAPAPAQARTVDDVLLEYLRGPSKRKRSHWRDLAAAKHLVPVFTGRAMDEVDRPEVLRYRAGRLREGASASTVNKETGLLSQACNYAADELGWPVRNPAVRVKLREPEGRVRWLGPEEAERLVAVAQGIPRAECLPAFVVLALNTGCRKSELLGLEVARVDLRSRLIYLEAEHTKGNRRRSVPLNAPALGAVRWLLRRRMRLAAEGGCDPSPWLFCRPGEDGGRYLDFRRSFRVACGRAGISDFRQHDLRHTCAAWLVQAGVPLAVVRDLLGHASIEETERYAHLAPANIREAVAVLEGGVLSRSGHAVVDVLPGVALSA